MFKPENNGTEFNFWPSIADTLLAIFMVFLMLWLAEKIIFLQQLGHIKAGNEALTQKLAESNKELEDSNKESAKSAEDLKNAQEIINEIMQSANSATLGWQKCEGEKQVCEKEKKRLIEEKARLSADLKSCERLQDKTQLDALRKTEQQLRNSLLQCESDKARYLRDKPPIINLPETLGFSFNTGKAQLSERFENRLKNDIVSKLREIKNKHNVNVIEIIGHTDGVIAGGNSNLDGMLENAVARGDISGLHYGSNADLGLMRALAVAFFLRKQPELRGVKFRVYSAAQLILADGKLTNQPNRTKDDARRRIELRFTHLED